MTDPARAAVETLLSERTFDLIRQHPAIYDTLAHRIRAFAAAQREEERYCILLWIRERLILPEGWSRASIINQMNYDLDTMTDAIKDRARREGPGGEKA